MQIAELTAYEVRLPLRREIKHASATRESSDNLLICCRLHDGTLGWGEGVPRDYVTGETVAGAFEQLAASPLSEQLSADCGDWPGVLAMCDRFQPAAMKDDPRGCYGNALRCAVELSILDAFGKRFHQPVSSVIAHCPFASSVRTNLSRVRYSAAITAESRRKEMVSAVKFHVYGFAQCKIKVGMPGSDDPSRLRRLRRVLGRRMDIRIDANEAWHATEVVGKLEPLLPCNVTCVEQPVPHAEVAALAEVRRKLNVPIMLDESLTSLIDAQAALRDGTCDIFNIRLSKCGGYVHSLRLAALARQHGLQYQLGCHPGESGILSAAGRHWASTVADIRYLEGSYDRHILKERLTDEDLTFGYGGWAPSFAGPGLGITVQPATVARTASRQQSFRIA